MSGELLTAVLDEIYAHAADGYPEEVCGFVLGGATPSVRRCENRQNALHAEDPVRFARDARTAYNLGPADLMFLDKSQRSEAPVVVIYHSHCDVGAYFSDEDQTAAKFDGEPLWPRIGWLVVDVQKDGARGAKLFRWDGASFAEVANWP
jgi:adenylyltransferase/sulfurtransferase